MIDGQDWGPCPPPVFQEMYGVSDIRSVQAKGVSGHNRKTVVPSWVRRDNSCFLYRGAMGEILLIQILNLFTLLYPH